jgi:hypothetical protein
MRSADADGGARFGMRPVEGAELREGRKQIRLLEMENEVRRRAVPRGAHARAHRANALFGAHRDEPEFGYQFMADETLDAEQARSERTA